ncbi:MAG: carbohydrate ABC transporter substrate-binding protein [Clostridia bacterium]|nr:carbohydrate ABC transporter substrate-binding protein [Clostridia bacterium]
MNRPNGKKLILWILSLILCVTACAPAFASTGDRVLMRRSDNDDDSFYVRNVLPDGEGGFYVIVDSYPDQLILKYTDYQSEPEKFVKKRQEEEQRNWWLDGIDEGKADEGDLDEENLFADDEQGTNEPLVSEYTQEYFTWNKEIYALVDINTYDGETSKEEFVVKRVKLENGEILLEEDNVPELDFSPMMDSDGQLKFYGISEAITAGDTLFMHVYGNEGEMLLAFDLQDGTCQEGELEDFSEFAAGPDGTLMVCHVTWDDDNYDTAKIKINKMDPATMSEEPLTEIAVKGNSMINPCYDAATDTLYYIAGGELWSMPHFEADQAVAVNDCPDVGGGMIALKDGFVLVQMFSSVAIRNTDPAQRGSLKLHIKGGGGYTTVTNAIYDMNNTRGDISVVADQDWNYQSDILQAMMNRDAYSDIFLLSYQSNEFNALRNRGYLIDMSGNEKIAADTARMYPYLQDALKQDGKIVAVPLYAYGYTLGANLEALKMLNIKEEDLPKTWNQFFDWMEKLPELMEGSEVKISWEDRMYLRSWILECMIEQYELWMEKKGETDYAFNTPILCDLIRRLNNLDYEGLGASEHVEYNEDDEDGMFDYDDDGKTALLEGYVSTTPSGDRSFVPMFLSFTDDEEPVVPVQIEVAFVNPYSEHQQEAMEFLGLMLNNLDIYNEYAFFADKTEPIRYTNQDESLTMLKEAIEVIKANIEKAEDDEKKAKLEETLKEREENLEEMERYSWRIGQDEIDRYVKNNHLFKVKGYSFYNALFGNNQNNDEDEDKRYEVYDTIFSSEESIKMAPEELMGMLDSKVQMIRMEGN